MNPDELIAIVSVFLHCSALALLYFCISAYLEVWFNFGSILILSITFNSVPFEHFDRFHDIIYLSFGALMVDAVYGVFDRSEIWRLCLLLLFYLQSYKFLHLLSLRLVNLDLQLQP